MLFSFDAGWCVSEHGPCTRTRAKPTDCTWSQLGTMCSVAKLRGGYIFPFLHRKSDARSARNDAVRTETGMRRKGEERSGAVAPAAACAGCCRGEPSTLQRSFSFFLNRERVFSVVVASFPRFWASRHPLRCLNRLPCVSCYTRAHSIKLGCYSMHSFFSGRPSFFRRRRGIPQREFSLS